MDDPRNGNVGAINNRWGTALMPPARTLLFIDADNTLWDTDGVFAHAQLRLLECVEKAVGVDASTPDRLKFIRTLDQKIAANHRSGLRYPPELLIAELAAELGYPSGVDENCASEIVASYLEQIAATPQLLPNVNRALAYANKLGVRVIVLTEGPKRRARARLATHRLTSLVERVVEMRKSVSAFSRIAHVCGANSRPAVIGDQFGRDVEPAIRAGLDAFHVPSRFQPAWERVHNYPVFDDLHAAVIAALKPPRARDATSEERPPSDQKRQLGR